MKNNIEHLVKNIPKLRQIHVFHQHQSVWQRDTHLKCSLRRGTRFCFKKQPLWVYWTWCNCRHCNGCDRGWWLTGQRTPAPFSWACYHRMSRTPWRTPPETQPPHSGAPHTASASSSPAAATSPLWIERWFYLHGPTWHHQYIDYFLAQTEVSL